VQKLHKIAVLCALLFPSLTANAIWPVEVWEAGSVGANPAVDGDHWKQWRHVPKFRDVSVHDPSVIWVADTYYVFGSHLAVAKSSNFLQWNMVAEGVDRSNPLFANVIEELSETFAWSGVVRLWANDVVQLTNGLFCMYPNLSRDDSPRGSLGLATGRAIEGPYVNQGIFLRSGMWGEISEDGVTVYDPAVHPNAVDPDAFHDRQGNLWMVYGSFSGGIFILQMDPQTGMPLADQGYGKRLMGGNHARIEGPNVTYSPQSRFYYLFVSFGGLRANGGYNLRVARSLQPDGPYYDALGNEMANVKADPSMPLFDDASIEPFAGKLMGSFLFQRDIGEQGSGMGTGYVSPGHSSVHYDEESRRYFIVFHTRFPVRGEFYQVRVHEMFINEEGWPVIAPHRYVPYSYLPEGALPPQLSPWSSLLWEACSEKGYCRALEKIKFDEVPGDYKLINHGKDISFEIKTAQFISLLEGGQISGEVSGTWSRSHENFLTVELDGVGTFKGVLSRGWSETAKALELTFTATSKEGISIWGSRLETLPVYEVLNDIAKDLSIGDTNEVTHDLLLPDRATRLATIDWRSSDPDYITDQGFVIRPEHGMGDKVVTLMATISYQGQSISRAFALMVKEQSLDALIAHYAFENDLLDSTEQQLGGAVSGSLIGSQGGSIDYAPGIVGNAARFDGTSGIRLPNGLIDDRDYSVSIWLRPDVITTHTTTFFGAADPEHWVSVVPSGNDFVGGGTVVWSGSDWYYASTGMNIETGDWSHVVFTVNAGVISVYVNGVLRFSDTGFPDLFANPGGVFSLGVNWWDPPFRGLMDELRIYDEALTAAQVAALSMA